MLEQRTFPMQQKKNYFQANLVKIRIDERTEFFNNL